MMTRRHTLEPPPGRSLSLSLSLTHSLTHSLTLCFMSRSPSSMFSCQLFSGLHDDFFADQCPSFDSRRKYRKQLMTLALASDARTCEPLNQVIRSPMRMSRWHVPTVRHDQQPFRLVVFDVQRQEILGCSITTTIARAFRDNEEQTGATYTQKRFHPFLV